MENDESNISWGGTIKNTIFFNAWKERNEEWGGGGGGDSLNLLNKKKPRISQWRLLAIMILQTQLTDQLCFAFWGMSQYLGIH